MQRQPIELDLKMATLYMNSYQVLHVLIQKYYNACDWGMFITFEYNQITLSNEK